MPWQSQVESTTAETLARRSRVAALAYIVLAEAIVASTSFGRDHPLATRIVAGGALVIGVVRVVIAFSFGKTWFGGSRSWLLVFRIGTVIAGGFWGIAAAYAVAAGLNEDGLVVLLVTAGIVAGAITSLSPDLTLLRIYTVCALGPIVVATLWGWGPNGHGAAAAIFFFLLFANVQGKIQHRDFLEAVERADLLASRATALEEARADAEAAQAIAAAANRAKTDFLANMSHEIRTPMTALIGYADLLLAPEVSSVERLERAQIIARNARHLMSILDDILDISKIEAGRVSIDLTCCDVGAVLAEVESLMRVRAIERSLDFAVRTEGDIPRTIRVDTKRLRQILLNLVGNAIKFTDKGGVEVVVRRESDGPLAAARLVVEVTDTGIGMTAAQTDELFAPFSQVDPSASRRFQGTGLGLHISRHYARMMDGDIAVRSELGKGSTFVLTLSLPPGTEDELRASSAHVLSVPAIDQRALLDGVRVLVAEDSGDIRRLIETLLLQVGAEVQCAEDGRAAVQMAMDAAEQRRAFDVVLLDMQMPLVDGYAAAAMLRSSGYTGKIAALTAHAMGNDRVRCLAAGCDEHLTKPIQKDELCNLVAMLAGRSPGRPGISERAGTDSSDSLIVSPLADDPIVGELLPAFFEDLGRRITAVRGATDSSDFGALSKLAHNLAGAGGSYGFSLITDTARTVERAIESKEPSSIVRQHVQVLLRACYRALPRESRVLAVASQETGLKQGSGSNGI